ncbi:hypothetical protein [Paenibacillus sp. NPDC093718]|uniref:hypothetical protein n=1 Tax=Paenibacillus sp. NPDC093718 TaxID=3390601 RepID=UPI003D0590E8
MKNLPEDEKSKFDVLIEAGIFNGVSAGIFGLDQRMNRVQMAKVAALAFELEVVQIRHSQQLRRDWLCEGNVAARSIGLHHQIGNHEAYAYRIACRSQAEAAAFGRYRSCAISVSETVKIFRKCLSKMKFKF